MALENKTAVSRIASMKKSELDDIALTQGGVVGRLGAGETVPKFPQRLFGYRPVWIDKYLTGQRDTLILAGTGERTRNLLDRGRARVIAQELNVGYQTAFDVVQACKNIKGAQNIGVQKYVVETSMWKAWESFPKDIKQINAWFRRWEMPDHGLGQEELVAAHQIVERLNNE